jgi:hypothetical protein
MADRHRYEAYVALLAPSAAGDRLTRASTVTQPGHPDRRRWWAEQPQVFRALVLAERDNESGAVLDSAL